MAGVATVGQTERFHFFFFFFLSLLFFFEKKCGLSESLRIRNIKICHFFWERQNASICVGIYVYVCLI